MLRTHAPICAAWGLITTVALGCGGKDPAAVDAAPTVDSPVADASGLDAFRTTAITIKTFPEGLPSYNGRTENATLVAFSDEGGPWIVLNGTAGVYRTTTTGVRYAVAVGCATAGQSAMHLYYQSIADTRDVLADGCPSTVATVRVSIELQGLQGEERGEVWIGGTPATGITSSPVDLDVPKGTADVFVRSYVLEAGTNAKLPVKQVRGATLDLQADQSLKVDVSVQGRAPESHPLSLTGLKPAEAMSETVSVHSSYATPNSGLQWPMLTKDFGVMKPDSYVTIDAAARQPEDLSNVTVLASGTTTDGRTYERYVRFAMKTPVAKALALPPIWTATAPTLERAAVSRATVTVPITPPTLDISDYHASFTTTDADFQTRTLTVFVRPGWARNQPSAAITTPDLSSLAGWKAEMALQSDAAVDWALEWNDRNRLYESLPVDGRLILGSRLLGQIPAPLP